MAHHPTIINLIETRSLDSDALNEWLRANAELVAFGLRGKSRSALSAIRTKWEHVSIHEQIH
jgi:hypothetical protein